VSDLRGGRPARARSQLEGSLAADPDGMAALNDLGVSYALEERFDAARQLLEEVLARGAPPVQQAALVNLGELYALDGYLDAALTHLASAREIDPTRAEPSYALALLADARADPAAAEAALREALVAEAAADKAGAGVKWRELAHGRFPALAATAQRHLEEP